ncbi:MAG TPA: nuclear transport factor 2 family protein [Ohtaekwangia sp.]|uniref:nuclear transport factor 2 family protein n=1 Tax=Ohtaekwangia sp. TaxID=2066019 RepID=UPI002F948218
MKHLYLLFLLLIGIHAASHAQKLTPEEQAVKQVIANLFLGMERGDSALVHAAFTHEITLATIARDKAGNPVLHRESSLDGFLKAVGTPHKEVWYEEIWNLKIQIDGDFAQAWCDYAFYLDKTFSHCGVDAFHLHKGKDGWKIFHLADTRRKTGCEVPKAIDNKHK